MITIAHLSDLHFGREQTAMAEAALAALHAERPQLVALSGDLTQRGLVRELVAARAFVDRLPTPVLVIPGNHDLPVWNPLRFTATWQRWRRHLAADLAPVVRTPRLVAVGVTTARAFHFRWDWSRGRIAERELAGIRDTFAAAPEHALRVLVAHHPFATPDLRFARRGVVGGVRDAAARVAAAGADLVLGGHVHLSAAFVAHGMVVAQAGTAFSDRLKGEPNGYNVIAADRTRLVVRHLAWDGARYALARETAFRRLLDGWIEEPG